MSAADEISVSVEQRGDIRVLTVAGVVDLVTAPRLEELVDEVLTTHPSAVIIDLTGVTFLASVGLRILAETHQRLGASGRLAVVATGPFTARPIQLTGLDEFLDVHGTVDHAVAELQSSQSDRT